MNDLIFIVALLAMYAINVALCIINCRSVNQKVDWLWTLSLSLFLLPMIIIIGTKAESFLKRNGW